MESEFKQLSAVALLIHQPKLVSQLVRIIKLDVKKLIVVEDLSKLILVVQSEPTGSGQQRF